MAFSENPGDALNVPPSVNPFVITFCVGENWQIGEMYVIVPPGGFVPALAIAILNNNIKKIGSSFFITWIGV